MEFLKYTSFLAAFIVVSALADVAQKCEQPECPYNQIMDNGACAVLVGGVCRVGVDERHCVLGATCDESNTCSCNAGNLELTESGRCSSGFGGACSCNSDCQNGMGLSCENSVCACPFGSTFNPDYIGLYDTTARGRCELAAGVRISNTDMDGPKCASGASNYEMRCICPLFMTYINETMTCECDISTSPVFPDPSKNGICEMYKNSSCQQVGLGYVCKCPTGTTKDVASKSCVCPGKNAYFDDVEYRCKQRGTTGRAGGR